MKHKKKQACKAANKSQQVRNSERVAYIEVWRPDFMHIFIAILHLIALITGWGFNFSTGFNLPLLILNIAFSIIYGKIIKKPIVWEDVE